MKGRKRWSIAEIEAQGKVPVCTKRNHSGPIILNMGPETRKDTKEPDCCLGGKCSFLKPGEPDLKRDGLTDDQVNYWLQIFTEQDGSQ